MFLFWEKLKWITTEIWYFKDDLTAKKYDEFNITLKTIRSDNAGKLIFAHLNINSIRNKFEFLATQVKGKIDVLMISETKTDEIFPKGNFLIEGFSIFYWFHICFFYGNLNEKDITDNKKFWRKVKPFLSDKSIDSDKIHLSENGELINSKTKTAEVLNDFFSNIVKNLKIREYQNLNRISKGKNPVLKAILKYKNHPSIIAIKEKSKNPKFTFHEVDNERIIKEIKSLNKNKASQKSDIPITIIHENADIFADFLAESLKGTIKTYNFQNCLKLADITPLHKKGRKDNKELYRPVSILPTLSKMLERILFE